MERIRTRIWHGGSPKRMWSCSLIPWLFPQPGLPQKKASQRMSEKAAIDEGVLRRKVQPMEILASMSWLGCCLSLPWIDASPLWLVWLGGTLTVGRVIYTVSLQSMALLWTGDWLFLLGLSTQSAWPSTMASQAMWHLQCGVLSRILSDTSPPHRVWLRLGQPTVYSIPCILWFSFFGYE